MRYIPIIIYLLNLLCAQSNEPQVAPLNPDFIKYQEDKKRGLIHNINPEGFYNSIVPHPNNYKIEVPTNFKKRAILPDRFDLRNEGFVTPVKNQGQCGSCWIFATMGSIESRWKQLGSGEFDLSENHAANNHGFIGDPCEGGNAQEITPYLIRGDGPLSESDDPYVLGKTQHNQLFNPQGIVTGARYLPNDMDVIKQCITDYGGIYSSFRWFGEFYDYYNQSNNTFFFSSIDTDTTDAGHAIVLIGWDDDMQTAGGIGAWIIKNSWGNNFGENGYFYISYQDVFLHSGIVACWPGRQDYNEHSKIYYYDKLGCLVQLGYNDDGIDYALVKYTIVNDETLHKIGTSVGQYTVQGGVTHFSFDIWDSFDNGTLSGLLGNTSISNIYICDYPGYYVYDIQNPIEVSAGDDIYIRARYQQFGSGSPIPVESLLEDYAIATIEAEGFWVSSTSNIGSWYQISGNDDFPYDPCIKIYTIETAYYVSVENDFLYLNNFKLNQNYPNPFNPVTAITFEIPKESNVSIIIYDLAGNAIKTLCNEYIHAGEHQINWNGKDNLGQSVSGGVYFYKIQAGDFVKTKKMVLLK